MLQYKAARRQKANYERRTLLALLAVNGIMFLIELAVSYVAESTALLADSLDNLADASVYALSLLVVAKSRSRQVKAARISGWLQVLLGLGVLLEAIRRVFWGSAPLSELIILMGAIALVANLGCLILIARHRQGGPHMRASWMFSANDVIANVGIILSGVLVAWLDSHYPDLIIGVIIAAVVMRGGFIILQEAREAAPY